MTKTILNLTSAHVSAFRNNRQAFTVFFALIFTLLLIVSANAQTSPFAGKYNGEWIAQYNTPTLSGKQEHEGTWKISIDSDGEVTGVEFDRTLGEKAELSGFIDEDGYIKVSAKYDAGRVTIKGTLEKRGARLSGTLKQACSTGENCIVIEITLKRN